MRRYMTHALMHKGNLMASTTNKPASRETLYAILGSFVLSLLLASILVGNPFRALGMAYFDYSHEPGVAAAAPTTPPTAPK